MASTLILSPLDGAKSFTDCLHCGSLCLGPTILPCGHVTCRKCLRHLLQSKNPCHVCNASLLFEPQETDNQLLKHFSSELVLHDLVNQRLQDLGQQSCHVCQNGDAVMICQDCAEMYCVACSSAHRKMRMSSDHVQQPLPHTLCNAPPGVSATTGVGKRSKSKNCLPPKGSISNLPKNLPSKSKQGKDMIQSEIQRLQKAANDLKEVAQVAEDVSILIQKLAEDIKGKQHHLDTYTARLLKADVRQGNDGDFYVSGLSNDDITADVKMQDLQRRLRDVRKTCHQFDDIDKLQSESARLIQKADKSEDPLTTIPRRVFETTAAAVTDQDTVRPRITDLLTTQDGLLLVADYDNKIIKFVPRPLSGEHTLPALKLENEPLCMSLLSDGLVAVTAENKTVYLVEVKSQLTVKSKFKTRRQCYGVIDGPDDVTLLVSCWLDRDGPRHASVDVIRRDGSLVMTGTDGSSLKSFTNVFKVFADGDHVLIPDNDQHCVYRVEVTSGRLVDTLKHPDLKGPTQVVADDDGNVYIACLNGQCVLVHSCEGEWRKLLHGSQHGEGEDSYPWALCLAKSGIVVVWYRKSDEGKFLFGRVIGYELVQ